MKTSEVNFNGLKVNGFLALFINLLVIPALGVLTIFFSGAYSCVGGAGIGFLYYAGRLFLARTERGPRYGVLR